MKTYPKIPAQIKYGSEKVYIFNKIDGSNIRAEWNKKKGFYKFGTRKRLLGPDEKPLGEAIELFNNKYSKDIDNIFRKERLERAVCFFEFYGEHSAFGNHIEESHDVILFDVALYKKGIISPKEFVEMFDVIDYADLLYKGPIDNHIVTDVWNGVFPGLGSEGVVCKSGFDRKLGHPTMFKIKRFDWYERLRKHCGDDEKLYEELS